MSITAEVGSVRTVTPADLPALDRLLRSDPVAHCFVASRLEAVGLDSWRMGGELLGYYVGDALVSALYCGANLVPVATRSDAREAFAERLRRGGRRSSSIVGLREEVLDLWRRLEPRWGPAREVRASQPLMVLSAVPRVAPDPGVRHATARDLDVLVPACIAMFTAEVGVSPVLGGMGAAYRARIADLVQQRRSFVRIDDGSMVFKAEVGASTALVCQVQGVWVEPAHRGRGVSEPAMAAVAEHARRGIAPTVSLYVNDYNVAARRCYEAVGFEQVDEFATVLF